MNNKLAILGTSAAVLMTLCIVAVVLVGGISQYLMKSAATPEPRRIVQLAAIKTPLPVKETVNAMPVQAAAVLERERPTALYSGNVVSTGPTLTPTPWPTATPTATPTTTPTPTPIVAYPGMATRLVIPKIGVDAPIVLAPIINGTWAVDHLDQMIGHLEGTAPPGSDSNIVLAGHVTLSAGTLGPFSSLSLLTPGDTVIVYEGGKEHLYQIENRQTVSSRDVHVVYPTDSGQVTLITCINWNSQEGRYTKRLVLSGRLVKNPGVQSSDATN